MNKLNVQTLGEKENNTYQKGNDCQPGNEICTITKHDGEGGNFSVGQCHLQSVNANAHLLEYPSMFPAIPKVI